MLYLNTESENKNKFRNKLHDCISCLSDAGKDIFMYYFIQRLSQIRVNETNSSIGDPILPDMIDGLFQTCSINGYVVDKETAFDEEDDDIGVCNEALSQIAKVVDLNIPYDEILAMLTDNTSIDFAQYAYDYAKLHLA